MTIRQPQQRHAVRRAFRIGVGSLLDMRGQRTYRAAQDLYGQPGSSDVDDDWRAVSNDLWGAYRALGARHAE